MKMLLYCTKSKPYLYKTEDTTYPAYPIGYHTDKNLKVKLSNTNELANLNGKIVAECDFEVERIFEDNLEDARDGYLEHFYTLESYDDFDEGQKVLLKESCLQKHELSNYLGFENGYAIHIKNLHIFDKPRELKIYSRYAKVYDDYVPIEVAPQNMMYAFEWDYDIYYDKCILISIQPQWLCKILNGEKTIEVRKKVLRRML